MKFFGRLTKPFLGLLFVFTLGAIARGAEPGVPGRTVDDSRRPQANDQKPGSLLVYNLYTSKATDTGKSDTDISLTNTNTSAAAFVHIIFVAEGGSVADAFICLTSNQTFSFLASDVDPEITGYIVAFATDRNGCPLSFNYLIGSEYFKLESGHAANLPAISFAALYSGTLPGCSKDTPMVTVPLDGVRYDAAPQMLAVDKIPSPNDGNSTMLIINSLAGNLAIGVLPIKGLSGTLFDDVENGFAFTRGQIKPQFRLLLDGNFPSTTPTFTQIIKSGTTGWMRLVAADDRAICGAVVNFHPNAATQKRAFSGGHNLAHLRYTSTSFIAPVFEPTC